MCGEVRGQFWGVSSLPPLCRVTELRQVPLSLSHLISQSVLETGSHSVAHANLELHTRPNPSSQALSSFLLPWPPGFLDYRHEPRHTWFFIAEGSMYVC